MSYSKQYSAYAHYSGSKSYSQHVTLGDKSTTVSGTVHYEGDVPIHFTVYVDTDPFDSSVDSCNRQVRNLTASVTAMEAAQCLAIKESSDAIADHVISGFNNMVTSEISQDASRLKNVVVSQIALLKDHSTRVAQLSDEMTTDYNRISSRYIKIFNDLDEECRKRIKSLDEKAFRISSDITEKQLRLPGMAIGGFLTSANEDCMMTDKITLSRLKSKTRDTIADLCETISKDLRFSRDTERVTYEKSCEDQGEPVFVPVLFCQTDDKSGKRNKCYVNDTVAKTPDDVCGEVNRYFSESEIEWSEENAVDSNIEREFNILMEQVSDRRVYDEIMRMKGGARTETNQARS